VTILVLAAMLATGGFFAYRWTQTQYYVGVENGQVAIFRGIAQTVGPIELSSVVETSELSTDELDTFVTGQLDRTIRATSLDDARDRVANLVADAGGTS
jgi:protein phosphatase